MHFPVLAGLSLTPIAKPIAAILAAIYSVVPNYGVAILVLSLGWMILISPLTLKTTRSMLAMQKLQPQIKKLQEKHANDRQALSQASMDLYKENNVSPFGSCLPTLLPLPIFFALFRVIDGLSTKVKGVPTPRYLGANTQMYKDIVHAGGHLNAFGLDLSQNVLSSHSGIVAAAPYVVVLLIMMGTQYWQTVSMMNRNPANADNPQAKLMKYLPLIFGVICIRFPAGVIVYYAMSNLCRIAQQTLMYRYDPKVRDLATKDVAIIDAEATDIETGKRARESTAPAPRSRFRDMLAQGVEQQGSRQQKAAPAKAQPGKARAPKPAANKPVVSKGNGSGNGSGKGSAKQAPAMAGTKPAGKARQAVNGSGAAGTNANNGNNGSSAARPRTGAGAGRTGAGGGSRSNKKRRGN